MIPAVGVCHYGVPVLNEIAEAGLPPSLIIELELSPFIQHKNAVEWGSNVDQYCRVLRGQNLVL